YTHTKAFYGLPLLFQDSYNVDAAAATQAHQQQLHGTGAESGAAALGAGIDLNNMSVRIFCLKSEIAMYPIQFNFYHGKDFCKCNSCRHLLCSLNQPSHK